MVRSNYYHFWRTNRNISSDRYAKALELLGLTETDPNPHIIRINGKETRLNHDRLINSSEAADMIMQIFQKQPNNQTLKDISISFEAPEYIIWQIIKDYEFNGQYNIKLKG